MNGVTFFSHHRKVEHRDGPATDELAPLKKSIFSLRDLGGLTQAATQFLERREVGKP